MTRRIPSSALRVDIYAVLDECIAVGVGRGLRRAYKHREDDPGEDARELIQADIERAVMDSISERFRFAGDSDDDE